MSETETTVQMDDKALFEAATSTEAPATETPAKEAATEQTDAGQDRDDRGRFAAKVEQPAQAETAKPAEQPEATQQTAAAQTDAIPPWRLREEAENRRSAEARAQQLEQHVRQLSGQLRQFTEKPPEAVDPYIDPEKFADQRARQAVDPVKGQVDAVREYYSKKDAIRTHGQETVNEAYKWLDQATRSDPRAVAFVDRVRSSLDPYEEIVTAYKRDRALSTVGDDPNAWFDKELERRMTSDPEFKAKLGVPQSQTQSPANIVKLPPSLNRTSGTNPSTDVGDMSDASLFAYAAPAR